MYNNGIVGLKINKYNRQNVAQIEIAYACIHILIYLLSETKRLLWVDPGLFRMNNPWCLVLQWVVMLPHSWEVNTMGG